MFARYAQEDARMLVNAWVEKSNFFFERSRLGEPYNGYLENVQIPNWAIALPINGEAFQGVVDLRAAIPIQTFMEPSLSLNAIMSCYIQAILQ